MKNKTFKLALILGVIALTVLACGFNLTTANFADAFMAKDASGNQRTTVFAQGDIFYAIVDLANAPDDTAVRADWFAVNVEGEQPNTQIDDVTITGGSTRLTFNLTNAADTLWPTGQYRVDLYLNDKLETTLEFEVQ
jgi:hypothetical protein